jgi:D-3-phosphoglycerate dehydrogenase / 2-oxoglutarate reductase
MSNKILVTDSLFIFDEHIKKLEEAGYEVERLNKPNPSEAELCEAIKDKIGYILGGVEQVSKKIIDAASELKAIVVPGIGYQHFIPAWEYVTQKGIAIANAPDGPTQATAEWAMTAALMMNRNFLELGSIGKLDFKTTKGIENQAIGLIGFGRIARRIAEMLKPFRPDQINYYSKHRHQDIEEELSASYVELDKLLKKSDIVFVCVSDDAGFDFISKEQLQLMKDNSLLVSFMHTGIVNADALFEELESGRLRAASDYKMDERFNNLPLSNWFCFNGPNAFNTESETKVTSDMSVDSLINILKTGHDKYKVN